VHTLVSLATRYLTPFACTPFPVCTQKVSAKKGSLR
jgi:hypothetical protein